MASRKPPGEDRYADPRDDYRNGFLDAVMYCSGLDPNDERALSMALEVLHRYRDDNPESSLRSGLTAAMKFPFNNTRAG